MQWTGKRIFTIVMVAGTAVTTYQMLSKPQQVAAPQSAEAAHANSQSFEQKLEILQTPRSDSEPPAEVHFSSEEVSAELAQSVAPSAPEQPGSKPASAPISPDAVVASGDVRVKDYQVKLDGNIAHGQFLTEIAGKDIYVTLAGHLGSQDGYVTFDPTEFKIGDLSIPVSLLNSALQKKLAEQREQLKLPDGIAGLRVENGELVITQK